MYSDYLYDMICTNFSMLVVGFVLFLGFDIPKFYYITPLSFLCDYVLSSFVAYGICLPIVVERDIEYEMNKERKSDMYAFA